MAFFQDAIEEFKTLKPVGKVLVIGVLVAAAFIGYEVYRNRSSSGASSANVPTNDSGTNPFTITTQTSPSSTTSTNPVSGIVGTIAKGVVKVAPKPPTKVSSGPIHTPVLGGSLSGIQPVKPIQQAVTVIKATVAKVVPTNQNRGVASRIASTNPSFTTGPLARSASTSQVSPSEWMARAKNHPIEINGTFSGGR